MTVMAIKATEATRTTGKAIRSIAARVNFDGDEGARDELLQLAEALDPQSPEATDDPAAGDPGSGTEGAGTGAGGAA